MARPPKPGIDYFPHDTDAAHDEKVESICALYGHHAGYSTIFRLYERIYRSGGELDISAAETMQILAKNTAEMDAETFKKFLASCATVGIFEKEALLKSILTSSGIKKRIAPIIQKRQRMANLYKKQVSAAETPAETPQSKGKKSKEKNIPFLLFAETLKAKILETGSQAKLNDGQVIAWANDFRLMVEQDKRTPESIAAMVEAVFKDSFWKIQIRSAGTLRQKWGEGKLDRLTGSAAPAPAVPAPAPVPLSHRPLSLHNLGVQ